MIKKFSILLAVSLFTVICGAEQLRLVDATGGAPLEVFMQAALELSLNDESMSVSMQRLVVQEALKKLDAGLVDAVIVEERFVRNRPQVPLGAEALALYVSVANPGADISKNQVQEILSTYRPNWHSYNNLDLEIQRFAMNTLTPSGTLLRRFFGEKIFDEEILKVGSLSSGFAFSNSASIFFAQFFPLVPVDVKMLPVDGVIPTVSSVTSGKYPLTLRYAIVYKEKMPTALQKLLKSIAKKEYRDTMSKNGWLVLLPYNVEQ